MNKDEKEQIISEVKEMVQNASAIYLTDYSKISVADINNIRNEFRKEGVKYKVIKNTLFKRAIDETGGYDKLTGHLEGMTGFAFASTNPVAPAKIIKTYFDKSQKLSLKGCYIESTYYDGKQLDVLATLPSKNEIVAGILGSINAPASGIVGVLNSVMRELVSVIDEISKKQAA